MPKVIKLLTLAAAAAVGLAGCVSHSTDVPALAGPSGFAQSVRLTAVPDSISQNGSDTSVITITALGPQGQPLPNLPLRLQTVSNNVIADFGTLSAKNVVTNSNGTATVTFTSPAAPAPGSTVGACQPSVISATVIGNCVQIMATPTNNDASQAQSASVEIRLVPQGTINPPVKTPRAAFTFLPSSPPVGQNVSFDGSTSCAEIDSTGACSTTPTSTIVSYAWTFGDGGSASGVSTTHAFGNGGTFVTTLTVTNSTGGSASTSQAITVALPAVPTADFVVSPGSPTANTGVIFNADVSKAAQGHNIVQFSWNFGDPNATGAPAAQCGGAANSNTASTSQVCHVFTAPGTYNVTLAVVDDTGQRAVTTKTVTVTP